MDVAAVRDMYRCLRENPAHLKKSPVVIGRRAAKFVHRMLEKRNTNNINGF